MPRRQNAEFTIELLKTILAYAPETGQFFWRVDSYGAKRAGQQAGAAIMPRGYRRIRVGGKLFSEHRLAIAFTTGQWPKGNVDHINGITSDNRISNLRDVHQSLNVASAYARKMRRTGSLGIRFRAGAWEATIKHMGKSYYLGRFKIKEAAQTAYLGAAKVYRGDAQFISGDVAAAEKISGQSFIAPKPRKQRLTQTRLMALVNYDPATGIFTRKVSFRYKGREVGRPIGIADREGYLKAKIDGQSYCLHRLAYLYMSGNWPFGEIHHINHNPSDNRWINLADVTPLENNRLRRCQMRFDTIGVGHDRAS